MHSRELNAEIAHLETWDSVSREGCRPPSRVIEAEKAKGGMKPFRARNQRVLG